ncbi:hypothetical protein CO726_25055 [Bacillus fungorum]|uniref:Toxin n=1 Tax=Bacillus fungorum TaxID=2039284 RepID=A0A2G6Q7C2_9BACI|nr:type II toxin-antitoxin system MqsR family toxin [Bacillus fungorum]PIE92718.1 hypothetical protein CO726_25055 [Bacillus fungorum]
MASKEQVESKLAIIKSCISRGSDYFTFLSNRPDNRQTLHDLGFKLWDAKQIILQLDVSDYYEGPEPNESPNVPAAFANSEMWMFGKEVEGLVTFEVYIKFSFIETAEGPVTCCVSFHKAKEKIVYPFK